MTDSAYLGSESTYSECETFTDEDTGTLVHPELHEEVETDSAIDAALHDPEDAGNRLVPHPIPVVTGNPDFFLFPRCSELYGKSTLLCLCIRLYVITLRLVLSLHLSSDILCG